MAAHDIRDGRDLTVDLTAILGEGSGTCRTAVCFVRCPVESDVRRDAVEALRSLVPTFSVYDLGGGELAVVGERRTERAVARALRHQRRAGVRWGVAWWPEDDDDPALVLNIAAERVGRTDRRRAVGRGVRVVAAASLVATGLLPVLTSDSSAGDRPVPERTMVVERTGTSVDDRMPVGAAARVSVPLPAAAAAAESAPAAPAAAVADVAPAAAAHARRDVIGRGEAARPKAAARPQRESQRPASHEPARPAQPAPAPRQQPAPAPQSKPAAAVEQHPADDPPPARPAPARPAPARPAPAEPAPSQPAPAQSAPTQQQPAREPEPTPAPAEERPGPPAHANAPQDPPRSDRAEERSQADEQRGKPEH